MTTAQPSKDEQHLLNKLPTDGVSMGNMMLRRDLGWDEAKYWRVRDELLTKRLIALGKGKGGSVRRAQGDEQTLLNEVPLDGSAISNMTAINALGWKHDRYWSVRNKLIDDGILVAGKGRGGSIARAEIPGEEEEEDDEEAPPPRVTKHVGSAVRDAVKERPLRGRGAEKHLYKPIGAILDTDWAREQQLAEWHVEITAHSGKAADGRWSRPDLIVVSLQRFDLTAVFPYFDIWSFEVKRDTGWDITAIHEAHAHGRFVTKACAFFEIAKKLTAKEQQKFEQCEKEAHRTGVGLITATDAADFNTWEMVVEPRRSDTVGNSGPHVVQKWLTATLSEEGKTKIRKWKR